MNRFIVDDWSAVHKTILGGGICSPYLGFDTST